MREPVSKVKRQGLSRLHHFNPRSPWGERPDAAHRRHRHPAISIHAPRGGSDVCIDCRHNLILGISIHAPRGGSDGLLTGGPDEDEEFQSTLPVGGATAYGKTKQVARCGFQSTLPVGGATLTTAIRGAAFGEFQSTLPVGGATCAGLLGADLDVISIHAPRGGSDLFSVLFLTSVKTISIHAPRGGSDKGIGTERQSRRNFNPRSPWGERLRLHRRQLGLIGYFNPRSPWGERPE